jgi:hypothetical protein
MLAPDLHNFRLRLITVSRKADESLIQYLRDFRLRNDALNEGAAIASHHSAEFDEDIFAFTSGGGECLGKFCLPLYCAAIIEMRMCACGCFGHIQVPGFSLRMMV